MKLSLLAVLAALSFFACSPALAVGEPRVPLPPALYEGIPLTGIRIDVRDADTLASIDDPLLEQRIAEAFAIRAGARFSTAAADRGVEAVLAIPTVSTARWALYDTAMPGELILAIIVKTAPEPVEPAIPSEPAARPTSGWLTANRPDDLTTLYRSDRALVRGQINGGVGAFSDRNPWWGAPDEFLGGSPLFPDPAGEGWATWAESSVELGLHGATRLGQSHYYLFGNLTAVAAGSAGQDPWRSDTRFEVELEKAYAGVLWADPGRDLAATVSWGQENWQLNKGFLFSQYAGSFNAAQWGASYLAARTALEHSFLAKVRWPG